MLRRLARRESPGDANPVTAGTYFQSRAAISRFALRDARLDCSAVDVHSRVIAEWQLQRCRRVGRDRAFVDEVRAFDAPRGLDRTAHRAITAATPVEAGSGRRSQANSLECITTTIVADAHDVLEQPLADRPERKVIERVHFRRLKAPLRRPPVPAFPDRGCALADRVSPRWKTFAQL